MQIVAWFDTRFALLTMTGRDWPRRNVILSSPQSGRVEGRTIGALAPPPPNGVNVGIRTGE